MRCTGLWQVLPHRKVLVPTRIAVDRPNDGEAELAVEGRSLEVVGLQHDLPASPRHRLPLDGAHDPGAVALVPHARRNEEVADVAGPAPGPAIGSADDLAVRPAQRDGEEV